MDPDTPGRSGGAYVVVSRAALHAFAVAAYDLRSDRSVAGRPLSRLAAAHAAARAQRGDALR